MATILFQLGKEVQTLKWNLHYMSTKVRQDANEKYVRQTRQFLNQLNTIDYNIKVCIYENNESLDKLLILSNKVCIAVSNLLNETVHKDRAHKRGMEKWEVVEVISCYHAGICCTILHIILEKIKNVLLINTDCQDIFVGKYEQAAEALCKFEVQMKATNNGYFSQDLKCTLFKVHLAVMTAVLYCIEKCK
jgi:hypothetical protein